MVLPCECGARLDVPTIRGLDSLERVTTQGPQARWGNRQAVLLIGLLIALVGFGLGGVRHAFPPKVPFTTADVERDVELGYHAIQQTPANEVWQLWERYSAGLDRREMPALTQYRVDLERNTRWIWTLYAVGALGLAIAGSSLWIR
jgi:hypothetical protein